MAEGDVGPHVPVEIEQHRVEAHHPVEELCHVVVGLDLYGEGIEAEPEPVFNEMAGGGFPRHVGIDDEVRVVIPHRPVELAEVFAVGDLVDLALPARDENRQFLADGGGRGRLAVGAAQHGDVRRFGREGGRG